jgi:hypothetical protein
MTTWIVQGIVLLTAIVLGVSTAGAGDRVITIEEAYQAALGGNEIIKIAQESVAQADARIDQAWTYLYPRLTAQGAYTRFNETLPPGGGPLLFQPTEQYQAALVLNQPLYTGGRTLAALRAAKTVAAVAKSFLERGRIARQVHIRQRTWRRHGCGRRGTTGYGRRRSRCNTRGQQQRQGQNV